MILSDGAIGQMMEKVKFKKQEPRATEFPGWATTGKTPDRERNIITSLDLDPARHERHNIKLQAKYKEVEEKEAMMQSISLLPMVPAHEFVKSQCRWQEKKELR